MYVHVCIYIHICESCIYVHIQVCEYMPYGSQNTIFTVGLYLPHCLIEGHFVVHYHICRLAGLGASRNLPISSHCRSTGIADARYYSHLYVGSWDWNIGLRTCGASYSPIEPFPQLSIKILKGD